jgi:hypothetical protein
MYAPPKENTRGAASRVAERAPTNGVRPGSAGHLNNFAALYRMHLLCQKRMYLISLKKIDLPEKTKSVV